MRALACLLLLATAAAAESPCKIHFAVVWKDSLNNVKQGVRAADRKWLDTKMAKKYPELCYDDGHPPVALWINVEDATYHGTRTVTDTRTHSDPVHGDITDTTPGSPTYGQTVGQVDGTVETTTSTTREVPYSFDYNVMTMSLCLIRPDGSVKVLHNFRHNTIQRQWFGIAVSNRHPGQELIEMALKWMHDGGLNDPKQSVLPTDTR